MANTYTKIYIHVTFVVKYRAGLIAPEWKEELLKFICGIVSNNGQGVVRINCVADHVHILLWMNSKMSVADLMRDIKANSARFVNERKFTKIKFRWQPGYGAFSVRPADSEVVARYIDNQEEHHKKTSMRNEFVSLLKEHQVEFDEQYIFQDVYQEQGESPAAQDAA